MSNYSHTFPEIFNFKKEKILVKDISYFFSQLIGHRQMLIVELYK